MSHPSKTNPAARQPVGRARSRSAVHSLVLVLLTSASLLLAMPLLAESDRGATYDSLDAQATRVTTEYEDAYVIAERSSSGGLGLTLYTMTGRPMARLSIEHEALDLSGPGDSSAKHRLERVEGNTSTHWASAQLYSSWLDRNVAQVQKLELGNEQWRWDGQLYRLVGLGKELTAGDQLFKISSRVVSVSSRFGDIEVTSTRQAGLQKLAEPTGKEVSFATFSGRIHDQRRGQPLGIGTWYGDERVFAWQLPGLTEGWVDEERMEQPFPFEPDLAWNNVQLFGMWQMHGKLVAEQSASLTKNTVGCDLLHWLDDTIFRPCCDDHDRCFEKNGCTWRSWWVIGASWSCVRCNIEVVFCFLAGGGGGHNGNPGGGGGPGGDCERTGGEWCPPSCMTCTTTY